MKQIWKFFTSLRLTVATLSLAIVLVWVGTVAQADEGLYFALHHYFRSWWFFGATLWGHRVPLFLPGGYLLGTVLLVNLVAAHIKRFQWSWKKLGIHLTHGGIVLLIVGQLFTDVFSTESYLQFQEKEARSFSESLKFELALSHELRPGEDQVIAVPENLLRSRTELRDSRLPLTMRIRQYYPNCEVLPHADILQASQQMSTALAALAAKYSSSELLVSEAQRTLESPGRQQVWQEALAELGEKEPADIVVAAGRIAAQPERSEKLRAILQRRFSAEMRARFAQQSPAGKYAADRLERGESLTAENLSGVADQGVGRRVLLQPQPERAEMDSKNLPAAIVEFFDEGKSLGTWLVSAQLENDQEFGARGTHWHLALRRERIYHPFTVTLLATQHDVYPGSDIPKNYRSRVRVENRETGENREVDIFMNNPLRYDGLTFFQTGMDSVKTESGPVTISTLQVVHNPSWLAPYLGCIIVAAGMIYQFLFHLFGFIRKRTARPAGPRRLRMKKESAAVSTTRPPVRDWRTWLAWFIVAMFVVEFGFALRPPHDRTFAVSAFATLPVLSNGRVQPLDSLARNALLQIRNTTTVSLEGNSADGQWGEWASLAGHGAFSERHWYQFSKHAKKLKPAEWLLEVFFTPEKADERYIFAASHPDLLSLLKLEGKGVENSGLHYFSFNDLKDSLAVLSKEAERVQKIKAPNRSTFDKSVLQLQNSFGLYLRLKNVVQPQNTTDFSRELEDFLEAIPPGRVAATAQQAGLKYDEAALDRLVHRLQIYDAMSQLSPPLAIPPREPAADRFAWTSTGAALMDVARGAALPETIRFYAAMSAGFRSGESEKFNAAVADETRALEARGFAPELKKCVHETFFNRLLAFKRSMYIYFTAFLLVLVYWFNFREIWRVTAFRLILLAFLIHTSGLIFRMVLEGRPPVTNLYSSAIFIGWGAVVLGMILERFFRNGIGASVSSAVGLVTLIIAHNLSLGGDTMEMMRAVLDTNFWLATHVVVVTLGYASTFVAGFLALIYVFRGFFTKSLDRATAQSLGRMVYGIVCFATLFSFVGTVLGGIWADQSWGRFWGWDPKENGALIIVLWNALILHARWGGMVRERGLMNLAIFGNVVTAWSWFGVNMLGIGLHSYGFMDAALWWLMIFVASQLALIGLGSLPLRFWRSFRKSEVLIPPGPTKTKREPQTV